MPGGFDGAIAAFPDALVGVGVTDPPPCKSPPTSSTTRAVTSFATSCAIELWLARSSLTSFARALASAACPAFSAANALASAASALRASWAISASRLRRVSRNASSSSFTSAYASSQPPAPVAASIADFLARLAAFAARSAFVASASSRESSDAANFSKASRSIFCALRNRSSHRARASRSRSSASPTAARSSLRRTSSRRFAECSALTASTLTLTSSVSVCTLAWCARHRARSASWAFSAFRASRLAARARLSAACWARSAAASLDWSSATASAAAREMTLFTDVGDSDWSTDSTVGSSPWARAKAPSAFPTGVAGSATPPPPPGVTSGKRISVASGR
mmetsp:Transcript_14432/g.58904  ORF Transcript_14432/g.58904 Transcript_14432/m.58904 type:complete len:339 (-) Transcript_14432:118-1134(-)